MQVASRFRRPLLIALTGALVAAPWLAAPAIAGVAAGPVVGSVQTLDTSQYSPDSVRLGIDATGAATAFWTTSEGDAPLKYAVRPAGGQFGFSRPVRNAGSVGVSDQGAMLAMAEAANGAAFVAWAGENQVRYTTRSTAGELFASAGSAGNLGASVTVRELDVDVSDAGRLAAVWVDRAPDGLQTVRGLVGTIGQPFGAPVTLESAPSDVVLSTTQVEMDQDGRAMAVWDHDNGGSAADQVRMATAPADAGFGAATDYASVPVGPAYPSLAVAPDGTAVVSMAWNPGNASPTVVVGTGSVTGTRNPLQDLSIGVPGPGSHLAAVDDDGVAAVLVGAQPPDWVSGAGLWAFVSDERQDFSGSAGQMLSSHGTSHGPLPYRYELALTAGNGFTATWSGDPQGDDVDAVWSASTTGGVFDTPTQLSSAGTERVRAVRNASGDVVSAWDHEDVATPVQAAPVVRDTVAPNVTTAVVNPNPVRVGRTLKVSFVPEEDVLATVKIQTRGGKTLRTLRSRDLVAAGTSSVTKWNGRTAAGARVQPGHYTCWIEIIDAGGNRGTLTRGFRITSG